MHLRDYTARHSSPLNAARAITNTLRRNRWARRRRAFFHFLRYAAVPVVGGLIGLLLFFGAQSMVKGATVPLSDPAWHGVAVNPKART